MRYFIPNHAKNVTAAPAGVTTNNAIKTMLQVKPLVPLYIYEWGYFFDGTPSDIKVELVEVDVAATVTALVDVDISRVRNVLDGVAASLFMTLSTIGTGFGSSGAGGGEGTPTVVRNLDAPQISSLKAFKQTFPLGDEPMIQVANFARIRVTAAVAVNMLCYMKVKTAGG